MIRLDSGLGRDIYVGCEKTARLNPPDFALA
jgi:hypothetical protein